MKLAICLSGHMRNFDKHYPDLCKYILSKYDCDVYISTWKNRGLTFRSRKTLTHPDIIEPGEDISVDDVKNIYSPKEILVDDEYGKKIKTLLKTFDYGFQTTNEALIYKGQAFMMFYKIESVINMALQSGVNYDFIVRVRPDLSPLADIDFNLFPKDHLITRKKEINGHTDDKIWACGMDVARKLAVSKFIAELSNPDFQKLVGGECMLEEFLLINSIPVYEYSFIYSFSYLEKEIYYYSS